MSHNTTLQEDLTKIRELLRADSLSEDERKMEQAEKIMEFRKKQDELRRIRDDSTPGFQWMQPLSFTPTPITPIPIESYRQYVSAPAVKDPIVFKAEPTECQRVIRLED